MPAKEECSKKPRTRRPAKSHGLTPEVMPDIAYEIRASGVANRTWRIEVDKQVLGLHVSQLDAIRYAINEAREAWQQRCLRTEVIRYR